MTLTDLREKLKKLILEEAKENYGLEDSNWVEEVTQRWFDDQNYYPSRWEVILKRCPNPGRILDMAAGFGTFVLYGLHHGKDVWGIELMANRLEYYHQKIEVSKYPLSYRRIIQSAGENLPFKDETFDFVTSYQTLEHVADVKSCVLEMLRVLRKGGVLYLMAPNYNCFFEPHYRMPFLPRMNKKLARLYLMLCGRPTRGLESLQWVTEGQIRKVLTASPFNLKIMRTLDTVDVNEIIRQRLPFFLQTTWCVFLWSILRKIKIFIREFFKLFQRERQIDLWITKIG